MTTIPILRTAICPACGHNVAVPFLDSDPQPLATLAWPRTSEEARSLPPLPLDFVRCVDCGHIFNAAFDYDLVPYSEKPNLMFNRGTIWSDFVKGVRGAILARLPERPVVVEVGHGDGNFLAALADARPSGRFIGFDPNGAALQSPCIELRRQLFDTDQMAVLRPDLVVSRHVLEHLINPLGFLQQLSFAASCLGCSTLAYFETPCVDRVLGTGRTVDFYYEHSSHFTTQSFTRMLSRCGAEVLEVGHGYGGEVVFGFIRLGAGSGAMEMAKGAAGFRADAAAALVTIRAQLADLHRSGWPVAIWGGTGKSAAFMCRYGVDAERFPIVVDSDVDKVGTFVPGTGQEIRFRDWLLAHPAQVVIIPPQWRASDIIAEMAAAGIATDRVLIEHNGRLVDFHRDPHPYA